MLRKFGFTIIFTLSSLLLFSQESPVQGEDLLKCLGQNKNSELVSKLNNYIGNKDTKEDISFLNYGKGIQVNIQQSIVKSIDLYNDNNPYSTEFKKFQGTLPMDLGLDNTIHQVKLKIGEGYEVTGDVMATYQLNKVFKLNDDDDYRMTIEFNTGRLVMFSIAYVEGGAGGADDNDSTSAKTTGGIFHGNDFFTMMRKNPYNREFALFSSMIGYATREDRTQKLYINYGVDVRFANGTIQCIALYSGGQISDYKGMAFQPYKFDLPYGLRMENSRSAILKKLGPPVSDDGNIVVYKNRISELVIAFNGEKIDWVKIRVADKKAQ